MNTNNSGNRFLVNRKQAKVAKDHKARIHTLREHQPTTCQIAEITDCEMFPTKKDAISYCKGNNLEYTMCSHCC